MTEVDRREGALQRAVADACLAADADVSFGDDLRRFLEARAVAPNDVEAILAAPPRLAIYRSLVQNALRGVIVRVLPRTRDRLNIAVAGRFDTDVARFLARRGPRTHYLREVPAELFAWLRPQWEADENVPAYLADLAAYELAQFEVAAAPDADEREEVVEVALDRALAFAGPVRLLRFRHAVHELGDGDPPTMAVSTRYEPRRRDVFLIAYRDGHAVRWLELTRAAADLVTRWMRGEPVGGALTAAREQATIALPEVATLLADLSARGIILGGRGADR